MNEGGEIGQLTGREKEGSEGERIEDVAHVYRPEARSIIGWVCYL